MVWVHTIYVFPTVCHTRWWIFRRLRRIQFIKCRVCIVIHRNSPARPLPSAQNRYWTLLSHQMWSCLLCLNFSSVCSTFYYHRSLWCSSPAHLLRLILPLLSQGMPENRDLNIISCLFKVETLKQLRRFFVYFGNILFVSKKNAIRIYLTKKIHLFEKIKFY